MTRYRISRRAQTDLARLWHHTRQEWSPSQADHYLDTLFACFDAVAEGSLPGKKVDDLRAGYYKIICRKHLVFYRFGSNEKVDIVRVLHTSMDVERHL